MSLVLLLAACGGAGPAAQAPAASPPAAAPQAAAPPAAPSAPALKLLSFRDLLARPRAKADHREAYGADPLQFGELWLPTGAGPHPVAILVHGGCWRGDLPGLELMDQMAEALRRDGVAVWNIEYRRIGQPGGGYPGTFTDVGAAVDHLRRLAPAHRLDLQRVALSGHSAGGHLALWAAARRRTPPGSPHRTANPLPTRGVVTLAGINDLAAYRKDGPAACGGPGTIDSLVGATGRPADAVFADTSPAALLPLGVRQVIVSGALDPIVPPSFGQAYAAAAATSGDPVRGVTLAGAGHFELIDPTSAAWAVVRGALLKILEPAEARPRR